MVFCKILTRSRIIFIYTSICTIKRVSAAFALDKRTKRTKIAKIPRRSKVAREIREERSFHRPAARWIFLSLAKDAYTEETQIAIWGKQSVGLYARHKKHGGTSKNSF